jgi:pimeloyl-ACP methyl ester carboxylesterase
MKLVQRIALGYYRTKLKAIELISPERAAKVAFQLFCTPYTRRKTYSIPATFTRADKLTFTFQHHTIHGFQWLPAIANGKKALICHGFDSYSYRFERYIQPLLDAGFEVFAFDAPAHGLSSGQTITALLYKQMIVEINARYGPISSIMAHSFGSIAAVLAIEELHSSIPERLVLIAPATETTRSVTDFCRHLNISPAVKQHFEQLICNVGGNPAAWFSVARVIQKISTPTLWLHDMEDKITPYEDMKHLTEIHLPHVQFVITTGLGHSLYRDEAVAKKIITFLAE